MQLMAWWGAVLAAAVAAEHLLTSHGRRIWPIWLRCLRGRDLLGYSCP